MEYSPERHTQSSGKGPLISVVCTKSLAENKCHTESTIDQGCGGRFDSWFSLVNNKKKIDFVEPH